MLLNWEQLSQPPKLASETIQMPEFDGEVRIQQWTGQESDEWEFYIDEVRNSMQLADDRILLRAAAVAVSLVDENGKRLCDCKTGAPVVQAWPTKALSRVWSRVSAMNPITGNSVEEAEKNLPADRNGSGGSS